jgi:hypothetical protein
LEAKLMKPDAFLYWAGPIDQLDSLRIAVKHLLKRSGSPRERFDAATLPLVKYRAVDFPVAQRPRFERIMSARIAVRTDYGTSTLFEFARLSTDKRRAIQSDIIAMYESCLLDIGRMSTMSEFGQDFYENVYPRDQAIGPKPKNTVRSKRPNCIQ